jgi:hypothetical protein
MKKWDLIFQCGCTRCHILQKRYYGELITEKLEDVDYVCLVTGINYKKEENVK